MYYLKNHSLDVVRFLICRIANPISFSLRKVVIASVLKQLLLTLSFFIGAAFSVKCIVLSNLFFITTVLLTIPFAVVSIKNKTMVSVC